MSCSYDRHQIDPGQLLVMKQTPPVDPPLGISAVERETGLLKETLRVWERRYGFPRPLRDALGERVYPREQVERLRLIRRLMDQGWRPGRLMALDDDALQAAAGQLPANAPAHATDLLECLHGRDAGGVRTLLEGLLAERGLEHFVTEVAVRFCTEVGEAWARGELDIAQEHLFTEQIRRVLRAALPPPAAVGGKPHVLLTTFPEEEHDLALLFAEALLASEGARCTSLGAQTPLLDIVHTVRQGGHQVLVLAFSAAFPPRAAFAGLAELAAQLSGVEIWAGSAGLAARPKPIAGLRYLGRIDMLHDALTAWRAAHPA